MQPGQPCNKHTPSAYALRRTSLLILLSALLVPMWTCAQDCVVGVGCPFPSSAPLVVQLRTSNVFDTVSTVTHPGVAGYFFVSAGETYEWSTRAADGGYTTYDSELTLFNGTGTVRLCHGNDIGGNGAFITWTAPMNTPVFVALNAAPCGTNNSPSVLVWRCASCADLPEVLVPVSGEAHVDCGTDVRLRDPGGDGYYPNNANGSVVLHASGDARIRIRGPYVIETGGEQLRFHDGVGTSAPMVRIHESYGYIDFTGEAGHPITVAFRSNWSVFMAGFELEVRYIDECEMVGTEEYDRGEWAVYPNPSNGEWRLRCPEDALVSNMELRDLRGTLIRSQQVQGRNGSALSFGTFASISSGMYLLRLITSEGTQEQRVVVN